MFFFFFQAEDGIRDWSVTGVQTCALPIAARLRQLGHRHDGTGSGGGDADEAADRTGSDDVRAVAQRKSRTPDSADRHRQGLDQRGSDKIDIGWQRVDAIARHHHARGDSSRIVDPDQGQSAADIGTAGEAGFAYPTMHDRADEDGMTGGQLFIRFGQATDEFVAEDDARLGTAMLASGNMEVAAAHSRVGDVDRYPAVARFGDRHGPDSDAGAALPHESVLFNHRLCPHRSLASDSKGTVLDLNGTGGP